MCHYVVGIIIICFVYRVQKIIWIPPPFELIKPYKLVFKYNLMNTPLSYSFNAKYLPATWDIIFTKNCKYVEL